MTEDQIDAVSAVDKINDELFAKYNKRNDLDNLPIVSVTLAGMYVFVSISIADEVDGQELKLYNSENNDRIYYEKSDKYETFYKLIKRKFLEVKGMLNDVKL